MILFDLATVMNPGSDDDREFAYGSGLLNPIKAVDPGLVFDAKTSDYINFLCKQGYNSTTLRSITSDRSVCKGIKSGRAWDLNYPSFALGIEDGQEIKGSFIRKVTNVGSPNSTYNVQINVPDILKVKVEPSALTFTDVGEKKSFVVKVDGPRISQVPIISGSITWKDGVHEVRTPLVVHTVLSSAFSNNPFQQFNTESTPIGSSTMYAKNRIFYEY